jgi:hypothetical protein
MRSYDAATLAALQNRAGVKSRILIWVTARNRATGEPEAAGFWNGDQVADFDIGGVTRRYYAAGALISVDTIAAEVGVGVRMQRVVLSPINDQVESAIFGFETRLAPIEMHRVLYDVQKGVAVSTPHRVFRGWIDDQEIVTAAVGGESQSVLNCASSARALTRSLSLRKSDASQRLRGDDRFYRYTDVTDPVEVPWGD